MTDIGRTSPRAVPRTPFPPRAVPRNPFPPGAFPAGALLGDPFPVRAVPRTPFPAGDLRPGHSTFPRCHALAGFLSRLAAAPWPGR